MRPIAGICAIALWCGAACHAPRTRPPAAGPSTHTPVWQDDFDRDGLPDPARWDYETGRVRNREAQYYTRARRENARIENGVLVIEARRETFEGAEYTSASLTSRANWTYGRIDVRARVPKGRGTWPAIWTLGANIKEVGWPQCGEIDIMEHVGFNPGRIHANVHTAAYNHVQRTAKGDSLLVPDADERFHVYSLDWTADRIAMSVDGRRYFTFERQAGGDGVWPFHRPQYLILNLAIGGTWGGQKGIDEVSFPARYEIDYVRVYPEGGPGKL